MKRLQKLFVFGHLLLTAVILNAQVTVSSFRGVDIELGGHVELEFVDVEGPGGFSNQDLTVMKVKTRSPHVRIDEAVLEARVNYSENFQYVIEYRFDNSKAYVDIHYVSLNVPSINTRFEFGNNKPFVAPKRYTEGNPLIGTAYWKGREIHLTSETKGKMGAFDIIGGLSVGMKRPIATDDIAEDKSFKMLVYGDYTPKDGQTWTYGAKGGLGLGGVLAEGWFYYGKLIDDFDWKTQLAQSLDGYSSVGDREEKTHYWFGGRLTGDWGPLHSRVEYIYSKDGLLPREGAYAEAGLVLGFLENMLPVEKVMIFGRRGFLNLKDINFSDGTKHEWSYLAEPMSWSRKLTTASLMISVNKHVTVKAEYYWPDEETNSAVQSSVKDNQGLVQINFAF